MPICEGLVRCCVMEAAFAKELRMGFQSRCPRPLLHVNRCASFVSSAPSSASVARKVEAVGLEGGLDFKGTVPEGIGKTRLDAWLAGQLPLVSRARVQSNIRQGSILVNGKAIIKGSYVLRPGDVVECELTGWAPVDANPEDIPLDIVYEDKHVIVINKPAHMVCASVQGCASGSWPFRGDVGECPSTPL